MRDHACFLCHATDADIELYRVADAGQARLCPGCCARARACGYSVVWLPERLRRAGEQAAFRHALDIQSVIETVQRREVRIGHE